MYREVKTISRGDTSLSQGAKNAGLVVGGSVGGRATGATLGLAVDVLTCGMTMGLGTTLGGMLGAKLGKRAGERARLAPLRDAQDLWRTQADAGRCLRECSGSGAGHCGLGARG